MHSSKLSWLQAHKGHKHSFILQHDTFSIEMEPASALTTTSLRPNGEFPTPPREDFKMHDSSASLRLMRMIHWSRIVISIVLITAGAAIVGCEAHALHTYNSTNLSREWFLPLWPQTLDLRPNVGTLVGGAVVVLTSCSYLFCATLPACSPRFFFLDLLFITISLLGLAASAFATGFSATIYSGTGRDTIQSWTCRWYEGVTDNAMINTNSTVSLSTSGTLSSPTGFGRLCLESHAALDMLILIIILEVGGVGLSGASYWLERKLS